MSSNVRLINYISGAFLSNGLRIIILLISLPLIEQMYETFYFLVIWLITIFVSLISSYFVTRDLKESRIMIGAVEGIFSYLVYILLSFLGIQSYIDEMWIFLGFLLGGLLGGRLAENKESVIDLPLS